MPSEELYKEEPAKEKLINPELESQKKVLKWMKENKGKILADPVLAQHMAPILEAIDLLNEDFTLSENRDKTVLSLSAKQHASLNGVDRNSKRVAMVSTIAEPMLLKHGEADTSSHWWGDFLEQSEESPENLLATLNGMSGFWGVSMEPDTKTETGGAQEIQKALAQLLVEVAENQKKYATEVLPNLDNPPDPTSREGSRVDAIDFLKKIQNNEHPWQADNCSNSSFLRGINKPLTEDKLKYNPFIKFKNGEVQYRNLDKKVRVYRETNGGKNVEFVDIESSKVLSTDSKVLEELMLNLSGEVEKHNWQKLPETPNLKDDAPIIGISLGGSPRPDSALFRHSRSGQSVVHFHYNNTRQRLEMLFNHASFDGVPGIDWAMAIAETVGAKEKDTFRGIKVDWQPSPQPTKVPNQDSLKQIGNMAEDGRKDQSHIHEDLVAEMVRSLDLQDISFGNELSPEDYQSLKETVREMNDAWYKEIEESIDDLLKTDMGGLSKNEIATLKNRLLGNKMTVSKFIDLMARQYYGPEVVCSVPRDPGVRLDYLETQKLSDRIARQIKSFHFKKESKEDDRVFDEANDPRWFFDKIKSQNFYESIREAYKSIITENALTWLSMSSIVVIKANTQPFREITEVMTEAIRKELVESTKITHMTSHGGRGNRLDGDGKEAGGKLVEFVSALTTPKEKDFATGYSDLVKLRDGKEVLVYNNRTRLTPRSLEELNITDNTLIEPYIQKFAKAYAEGNGDFESNIIELSKKALEELIKVEARIYGKLGKNQTSSKIQTISTLLADLGINPEKSEVFQGLQYLIASGLLENHESFMKTCVQAGKDLKVIVNRHKSQ